MMSQMFYSSWIHIISLWFKFEFLYQFAYKHFSSVAKIHVMKCSHIHRTNVYWDLRCFAWFFHILKMTNYYYHDFHIDILCWKWSTLMYTRSTTYTVVQCKRPQYIWRQGGYYNGLRKKGTQINRLAIVSVCHVEESHANQNPCWW